MKKEMKEYRVTTEFIFKGYFYTLAKNEQEAKENVLEHCGLVIGGDIHSTLPDKMIDWKFAIHPKKIIKEVELK